LKSLNYSKSEIVEIVVSTAVEFEALLESDRINLRNQKSLVRSITLQNEVISSRKSKNEPFH
jgi:hypothetical protein